MRLVNAVAVEGHWLPSWHDLIKSQVLESRIPYFLLIIADAFVLLTTIIAFFIDNCFVFRNMCCAMLALYDFLRIFAFFGGEILGSGFYIPFI